MLLAEKIERVLYFCRENLKDIPEEYLVDCQIIKNRYSELKLKTDFTTAAKLARFEWIQEKLEKMRSEIHEDRDRLEEKN